MDENLGQFLGGVSDGYHQEPWEVSGNSGKRPGHMRDAEELRKAALTTVHCGVLKTLHL